jgi:hypothetical protein
VPVPMLEDHLRWLSDREGGAARRLVAQTAASRPRRRTAAPRPASEAAFRAFERQLEPGRRGDERIGVHALIARRRRERDELYARFLDTWRRLKAERFRPRLEAAIGIEGDA